MAINKYYLDTEFHEFKKKPLIGKGIDTIELISIGIVSDDDREYYAVCNEFDLKTAWKNEWLRENVLKPIYYELNIGMDTHYKTHHWRLTKDFSMKSLKRLLKWKGKSKKQIAEEIEEFTACGMDAKGYDHHKNIEFYAYYADYDWVVFCWLFGRMIDLPKGFPMYCKDLKQELDESVQSVFIDDGKGRDLVDNRIEWIKSLPNYPSQENEHNAMDDAKWNKSLHSFIEKLNSNGNNI